MTNKYFPAFIATVVTFVAALSTSHAAGAQSGKGPAGFTEASVVAAAVGTLQSADPNLRLSAVRQIDGIGPLPPLAPAIEPLIAALSDADTRVRIEAAKTLARLISASFAEFGTLNTSLC